MGIIKTKPEIYNILVAGKVVSDLKVLLKDTITEGISTIELEEKAQTFLKGLLDKGLPVAFSFIGQRAKKCVYRHALCVSVNDQIIHGIPNKDVILKLDDLVSVDVGVSYNKYHADSAFSVIVDGSSSTIIEASKQALYQGILNAVPGNRISDISYAIQCTVESRKFFVFRQFTGHGVGTKLHEKPQVLNFGRPGRGLPLVEGMVLAIEPIIAEHRCTVVVDDDGWAMRTSDGCNASHYEETIIITNEKPLIVTMSES